MVSRATPPWGRAFLRFSFRFRSLSFFLFASALHLETFPFRFDSLNCTTSLNGGKGQAHTRRNLWYNIRRCLDWNEVFMWRTRVRCEEETVKLAATAAEWAGSRWMKGRRNGFRRTDCWRSAVCGCAGRGLCRGRRRFRRESWGATRAKGPKSGIRTEVERPPSVFFCRGDGGKRQPDSKVETGCLRFRVRLTLTPRQADSDPESG